MSDEPELAKDRQPDDYERHLAAEIIALIHNAGGDPSHVLAYVHAMLNVELPGDGPQPPEALRPPAAPSPA